jgi:hypothetical protein
VAERQATVAGAAQGFGLLRFLEISCWLLLGDLVVAS